MVPVEPYQSSMVPVRNHINHRMVPVEPYQTSMVPVRNHIKLCMVPAEPYESYNDFIVSLGSSRTNAIIGDEINTH